VPILVEANGRPRADRQWALYLAAQALRDRVVRSYDNLYWNKTKVSLVGSEVNSFSGVIAHRR
jgi:hypothetical protein